MSEKVLGFKEKVVWSGLKITRKELPKDLTWEKIATQLKDRVFLLQAENKKLRKIADDCMKLAKTEIKEKLELQDSLPVLLAECIGFARGKYYLRNEEIAKQFLAERAKGEQYTTISAEESDEEFLRKLKEDD